MRNPKSVLIFVLVAIIAFAAGAWWNHPRKTSGDAGAEALYYSCPMHPDFHLDHAGDCPSCGMRLEPVFAGSSRAREAAPAGPAPAAGSVKVTPERQQAIGVRLGVAEQVSGALTLRTTGRVTPNENAVYPLVAGGDGWIREVRGATTGALVKKDDVLLAYYTPEFVVAQQSYYSGLDTLGRVATEQLQAYNQTRVVEGVERYANTLRNLGVSERQLEQMRQSRALTQDIQVVSPVDGFVLQRGAAPGLRCDRGFEFYRIADLHRIWVLADVYENQLGFIRAGAEARITSRETNRRIDGRVSRAEPIFDESTRTLKVRVESDNPGLALKPGMFVDVEFGIDVPATLAVPSDAIVDTGLRKTLFVDRGGGYFEPRQVETGWRLGDRVEVVKGLMPGERIVISGTFLVDSESRMTAASKRSPVERAIDPVCGMLVDAFEAGAAGRRSEHDGVTYYFCSDDCKKQFDHQPARFAGR